MYWGVIATDPSRLRLNLVSFHQHCIRYVLTIIQLFIDREPIGLKQEGVYINSGNIYC